MKMPAKEALVDIIKGMKKLRLEKVSGFRDKEDESPTLEIEEEDEDELEDED